MRTIIADDAANHEELSLFVDFLEVERITGRVLGEAIISWLKADMRGQCYDGAWGFEHEWW